MTRLDAAIARARSATVDRAAAERYVRELDRWAGRPEPRRWWPWLAGGVAGAALAAAVLLLVVGRRAPVEAAVQVGAQVAVVAAPETAYRVVRADRGATEIAVERGAVTARLWHGARAHRLALTGGGVTAIATGTVFSLEVGPAGPAVHVVEGTVEVRAPDGVHLVTAPASWPAPRTARPAGARVLLAMTSPSDHAAKPSGAPAASPAAPPFAIDADAPRDVPDPAGIAASDPAPDPASEPGSDGVAGATAPRPAIPDGSRTAAPSGRVATAPGANASNSGTAAGSATAGSTTAGSTTAGSATAGSPTAGSATAGSATAGSLTAGNMTAGNMTAGSATAGSPTAGNAAPLSIKDRWRTARLLRSQGRFAEAIAECLAISNARDATWSPIALVEATRVALGPLADPEQAILLAERMAREWPHEPLANEARSLRCRALTQLGRGAECSHSPIR